MLRRLRLVIDDFLESFIDRILGQMISIQLYTDIETLYSDCVTVLITPKWEHDDRNTQVGRFGQAVVAAVNDCCFDVGVS